MSYDLRKAKTVPIQLNGKMAALNNNIATLTSCVYPQPSSTSEHQTPYSVFKSDQVTTSNGTANGAVHTAKQSNGSITTTTDLVKELPRKKTTYTWDEIQKHNTKTSRWLVIDSAVYDVTRWQYRHPGGSSVLGNYAGQDASEAFTAFHPELYNVTKYLKACHIGHVDQPQPSLTGREQEMQRDFNNLRLTAHRMGLFESSKTFFFLHLMHIVLLQVGAYAILWLWTPNWLTVALSLVLFSTAESQASWLQHDFGHLSVFHTNFWNKFFHYFVMAFLKRSRYLYCLVISKVKTYFTQGASPMWWIHMHNQHHSKPNIIDKDPDVRVDFVFVLGEKMPRTVAETRSSSMPFDIQQKYFFFLGPPLLFPVYFQFMTFYYAITRRMWLIDARDCTLSHSNHQDLFVMGLFYSTFFAMTYPVLGLVGMLCYFELFRILESHWFTWVSQSNHIPMTIDDDRMDAWLPMQIRATCDIERSHFNDWFTGHLNFQIEHHLFPTMPRHNYYKVQPLVRSLCAKYGLEYQVKPLWTAFADIIRSLRKSGELWLSVYQAHHLD